jgi:hypothetical protein
MLLYKIKNKKKERKELVFIKLEEKKLYQQKIK